MSKRRRRGGGPPFVQLYTWLLDSPAWVALSPNARCIYVEIKRFYDGKNNGFISFSARQAGAALGASQQTGSRAVNELIEQGFIEIAEESDFNRKVKIARSYLLTEVADDRPGRGRIASKAFLRRGQNQKHSSMGEHHSSTHGTVGTKTDPKIPEQFHPWNCDPPFSPTHSSTHGTHIHLSHRRVVSDDRHGVTVLPLGEAS